MPRLKEDTFASGKLSDTGTFLHNGEEITCIFYDHFGLVMEQIFYFRQIYYFLTIRTGHALMHLSKRVHVHI